MAKIIIVNSCEECTRKEFSATLASADWYCKGGKYIRLGSHALKDRVHPDCPLEDVFKCPSCGSTKRDLTYPNCWHCAECEFAVCAFTDKDIEEIKNKRCNYGKAGTVKKNN